MSDQTEVLFDVAEISGAHALLQAPGARGTLFPLEQPPIVIAVGRAVRKLRQDRELSQAVVAAQAGVSRTYLSEIERGQHDLRLTTIDKLAGALGESCGGVVVAGDKERAMRESRARRPR